MENLILLSDEFNASIDKGDTVQDIAFRTCRNHVWVSQVCNLKKLIPEARQAVLDSTLCVSNAFTLSKLMPDRQKELLKRAIESEPKYFAGVK